MAPLSLAGIGYACYDLEVVNDLELPRIFQWANHRGNEQLTSNGEPLEKCYWNRAIGLDLEALGGRSCTLRGVGTASTDGVAPPADSTRYPAIAFRVEVLDGETGALCGPNPLNGADSGVQTGYLREGQSLTGPNALTAVACGDQRSCAANGVVTSQPAADTLRVQTAGGTADIPLTGVLAGYQLGDGCCLDNCCVEAL